VSIVDAEKLIEASIVLLLAISFLIIGAKLRQKGGK
jgi:hypothetical protein